MNFSQAAQRMGAPAPAPELERTRVEGYSIDSRTCRPGDLFFAVKGEQFDGHDFVYAAIERGAHAAVVERPVARVDPGCLLVVDDALAALQRLAAGVLAEAGTEVIGVTGSAGKTTTKDLIASVVAQAGPTHKSSGNFNNAYGLPLTVLETETGDRSASDYRFAVLEMGMSTPGEIRRLTEIAPPSIGVVTIVAPAHVEFFEDGVEGVARAKAELVEGVVPGGTIVLNADDARVARMADLRSDVRVLRYGFAEGCDATARDVVAEGLGGSRFRLVTPGGEADVRLALVGRHNVANALAAAAAGVAVGVAPDRIALALESAAPSARRGEIIRLANGATVVDDSYNSNPRALEEMVASLAAMPVDGRRIVVAGEMLELGAASRELHRLTGYAIARAGVDHLIGVRGDALALVEGAREAGLTLAAFVETPEAAAEQLLVALRPGDVVLVKGSRGVATDRTVASLVAALGVAGTSANPEGGG